MFLIEKPKNSFMMIKPQVEGEIQGDINVNLSRESIGLASVQGRCLIRISRTDSQYGRLYLRVGTGTM